MSETLCQSGHLYMPRYHKHYPFQAMCTYQCRRCGALGLPTKEDEVDMINKIDFHLIKKCISGTKLKKPPFIFVDDQDWADALDRYHNNFTSALAQDEIESTEVLWNMIYFSALAFCKGMEYQQVKSGTKTESNYPRY